MEGKGGAERGTKTQGERKKKRERGRKVSAPPPLEAGRGGKKGKKNRGGKGGEEQSGKKKVKSVAEGPRG